VQPETSQGAGPLSDQTIFGTQSTDESRDFTLNNGITTDLGQVPDWLLDLSEIPYWQWDDRLDWNNV
jgi:hypothetical protein